MKTKNDFKISLTGAVLLAAFIFTSVEAAPLNVTNTFVDGNVLSAGELNTNFTEVEAAVNDNDNRITTLEGAGGTITRTISIPARALAFNPASANVTLDSGGLSFLFTFQSAANFFIKKPFDYAGGDITMSLFFRPATATAGVVDFFIRPTSFDSGETQIDPGSLTSQGGVNVAGLLLHEQNITIPAGRMTKAWWTSTMQREGSGATYPDPVVLKGISLEYTAVQ